MAKSVRARNGMQGVFLVAAELTYRGFIVSVTSRNAYGADLLVTDELCKTAWSVQVKTNQNTSRNYWLLSSHSESLISKTHVYVFVALQGKERPKFLVVPSRIVARNVCVEPGKSSTFYSYSRNTKWEYKEEGEGWDETFGVPASAPTEPNTLTRV